LGDQLKQQYRFKKVRRVASQTLPVISSAVFLTLIAGNVLADTPSILTTSPLLQGTAGTPYTQIFSASGGTRPYTWVVSVGSVPPGVTLNSSSGTLSGTPSTAGTFSFTVTVTDAAKQSALKTFSLTIGPALAILTDSRLPDGIVAAPYSNSIAATGGTPPYQWKLTSGLLPQGLTLNAGGLISGTPAANGPFTFAAQVADASQKTATRTYSLNVFLPQVPAASITGIPDAIGPAQQITLGLSLSAGYPLPLNGEVDLTFQPDAVNPSDDAAIQFLTGGRTATFTVPVNAVNAIFSSSPMALQTGTVAGVITLSVRFSVSGSDQTPSPPPSASIRIPRSAPRVRDVSLVRSTSGFEVHITGFSPNRQVTQGTFQFAATSGQTLQTTSITVPLDQASGLWYQSAESVRFGSQFTLVQPFTVQGSVAAIGSVAVVLMNSEGTSQSVTATF
jgi:hypothetical protein